MSEPIMNQHMPPLALAELHLPAEPSFFPLAWGWWLLILACLLALFILLHLGKNYLRARQAKNEALHQLPQCQSIAQVNVLLKRAALSYFAREQIAMLTGDAWLAFLDSQLPAEKQGFAKLSPVWNKGNFSSAATSEAELQQVKKMAKRWLQHAVPRKKTTVTEANHV